jgi:hypothetical protein
MIDPILPAAALQALMAKVERPLLAIAVTSMPKALARTAQPREIGGTVTQAALDGSAVLHTAAGDIGIKAPVALAQGRTATLFVVPTPAGLTAALQVNGPTAPTVPAAAQPPANAATRPADPGIQASPGGQSQGMPAQPSNPASPKPQAPTIDRMATAAPSIVAPSATASGPSTAASPIPAAMLPAGTNAPLPQRQSPSPTMPASPGLRDAALLISQLAAQLIDQPLPAAPAFATGTDIGEPATPPISILQLAPQAATANAENRPLPADPVSLLIGLSAAVRRPQLRAERDEPRLEPKEDRASIGELGYRPSGKTSEPVDGIAWRQFQVMDETRVVPVSLGRHPQQQADEEQTDRSPAIEPPARFTVRFDLDHAGPVCIDSVYRDRRLDMLLTLEAPPDQELQASVRDRLAALSDEFGLSISLRIGGPAPAAV